MKILNWIQNHYRVHTDDKTAISDLKKSRTLTTPVTKVIYYK